MFTCITKYKVKRDILFSFFSENLKKGLILLVLFLEQIITGQGKLKVEYKI